MEVRQRQLDCRDKQRGRQEEQRISACHVSFLSITHGLSIETARRAPTVQAKHHGCGATWAAPHSFIDSMASHTAAKRKTIEPGTHMITPAID